MEYRKDLQVLRGIAVLFVVLFHLEVSGVGSGFLGVDVFFVISGFLMSCLYRTGRAREFFRRRAHRILPAYFLTILVTLVGVAVVATPNELDSVGTQTIFAALLAPNVDFWLENSYFAKDTFKPLLHLWSLGVEIQFYLLVPAFQFLAIRYRIVLPVLIAASAGLCFLAVGVSPKTAFFLVPFRLWEFLLGFLAARAFTRNGIPIRNNSAVTCTALVVLLVMPFSGVDGEALSPVNGHPGFAALAICLATAVILACGLPHFLLRLWPAGVLETLGKYSYSVYLVHYPVIAIVLYHPFAGTVLGTGTGRETVAIVVGIAAIPILLYRFVESPLRSPTNSRAFAILGTPIALIALAITAPTFMALLHTEKENFIYAAAADRDVYRCGKIARILHPFDLTCVLYEGSPSASKVVLVGNSHADSIKHGFARAAREREITLRFLVPNNPLMVDAYNADVIVDAATQHRIGHIVLHFSPGDPPPDTLNRLVSLAEERDIKVDLIAPVPVWQRHVPAALFDNLRYGIPLPQQNITDLAAGNGAWRKAIEAVPNRNFRVFEAAPYLCRPLCRLTDEAGRPLYFDTQHLTLTGSAYLQDLFREILAPVQEATETTVR